MINIVVKKLSTSWYKKPIALTHTPKTTEPITSMFVEAARRDRRIKELVAKCPYKAGDIVGLTREEDKVKYGDKIKVDKIVDNYAKFGKTTEWPEHDCPLLIHAHSIEKNINFFCSINFLKPL